MNTLQVRSMPENLDKRLQQIANARNRALSAQVITMLSQAADEEKRREQQAQTLVSFQRRRFTPPKMALPHSTCFVRIMDEEQNPSVLCY